MPTKYTLLVQLLITISPTPLIIFYTASKIIAKKLHLIDMLTNFIIVGIMIQLLHTTEIVDYLL